MAACALGLAFLLLRSGVLSYHGALDGAAEAPHHILARQDSWLLHWWLLKVFSAAPQSPYGAAEDMLPFDYIGAMLELSEACLLIRMCLHCRRERHP